MLDLYAKLYGLSKAEANRQIREALNLGQYRDDYKIPEKKPEPEIHENSDRASDAEINHTYSMLLSYYQKSTGKTCWREGLRMSRSRHKDIGVSLSLD